MFLHAENEGDPHAATCFQSVVCLPDTDPAGNAVFTTACAQDSNRDGKSLAELQQELEVLKRQVRELQMEVTRLKAAVPRNAGRGALMSGGTDWARVSPFTEVQFEGPNDVKVRYEGTLYELVAMDQLATATLLGAAKKAYGDHWKKRFVEDIVEVMEAAGQRPGETVSLELLETQSGETRHVDAAPLTAEHRRAAKQAFDQANSDR